MNRIWMIRAGEGAYLIEDFVKQGIASMGWNEVGDLQYLKTRDEIKEMMRKVYPQYKPGKINQSASQLYKFAHEIKVKDNVVTYDPSLRIYHIGNVEHSYVHVDNLEHHHHMLDVKWESTISRDDLSPKAKNHLGSIMTLFEISEEVKSELLQDPVTKAVVEVEDAEEEYDTITDDTLEKAHEFIKDKFQQLDWEEMQELVAGLLRGMGYKTKISSKGPDRGRDIIASPDGLGLEDPRIIVEVKHRKDSMSSDQVRSFTGGLRARDKGLYVSTGGFTKEAKYEAERSNNPLTLVDADDLVRLINQYYDKFDSDTKALIPLRRIYWPV